MGSYQASEKHKKLITPHGDWKHAVSNRVGLESESSLPLMGIGNAQPGRVARQEIELITPHGDWKPGIVLRLPNCTSNSLPLMGIGNFDRRGYETIGRNPHYPSWGLETGSFQRIHARGPTSRTPAALSLPQQCLRLKLTPRKPERFMRRILRAVDERA